MGTLLGVLMHLSIRFIIAVRPRYKFRIKFDFRFSPEIKETIKLMAPKIVQFSMWGFLLLSFTSITSELAEGSVAVYNYARNFQSIPVSLLGIAIAMAMYTSLSHDAGKGNFKKFKTDFRRNRIRSLVYTILAAAMLAIVATPMVRLLLGGGQFGEPEIQLLADVIRVYAISVPLESMLHIYHRSFYSLKNTIIPAGMHTITILIIIISANALAPTMGVFAIPASFAGGLVIHITVLATIFPILLKKREKQSVISND